MNARFRKRLERAERVRDFLRAHLTAGVLERQAVAHFEALVERVVVLAMKQRSGVAVTRAATRQRMAVRRGLQLNVLRYLSVVVRLAATSEVQLEMFRLPRISLSTMAFVTMARAMLETAMAHRDVLVRRGLPEALLAEVARGIEEIEHTLEATHAGLRERVGASADLKAVLSEISVQVRLLEGLVRYRFGDNAEVMGAWASARNAFGPSEAHSDVVKPAA
jgi:hypothetical protein